MNATNNINVNDKNYFTDTNTEYPSLDDNDNIVKFCYTNLDNVENNKFDKQLTIQQACLSQFFKTILENTNFKNNEIIPVTNDPKYITPYAYNICMEYLQYHNGKAIVLPPRPLKSDNIETAWENCDLSEAMKKKVLHDISLVKKIYSESDKCDKLYEVLEACNYLDINPLLHLCSMYVASLCKKHSLHDFNKIFGTSN